MTNSKGKNQRKNRVRARIKPGPGRSRLVVFRSNQYISGQIIDQTGKVLAAFSERALKDGKKGMTRTEKAELVGLELAKLAIKKKIKQVVFDRGEYQYHGRVKALADGARKGGLEF